MYRSSFPDKQAPVQEISMEIGDRCGTTEVGATGPLGPEELRLAEMAIEAAIDSGEVSEGCRPLEITEKTSESGVYTAFIFNYAGFGKFRNHYGEEGADIIRRALSNEGEISVRLREVVRDLTNKPHEQYLFD